MDRGVFLDRGMNGSMISGMMMMCTLSRPFSFLFFFICSLCWVDISCVYARVCVCYSVTCLFYDDAFLSHLCITTLRMRELINAHPFLGHDSIAERLPETKDQIR